MSEAIQSNEETPPRRFRPYPEYKDSGIEWLGKIPAHWDMKRLKRLVEFCGGGTPPKENLEYWRGNIPWVSPKDMKVSIVSETEDKITPEAVRESATKLIPAGSVLIVVRSGILIHRIPVAIAGRNVTLNQDLKALLPRSEIVPEYLMYLIAGMQHELLAEWKKEGATVESLELDLVANTPTPLPAPPEQRTIATFLDRETARIDALVERNERLIELLQEKRTALITRAVTRGLDPNVPMKDPGVGWLGEIPAHWEVKRWRYCCRITEGLADPTAESNRDRVMIAPNHVESGTGRILLTESAQDQGAISGKYLVNLGDLIYSKIRPALNKVCVAEGEWLCSADMYPVKVTERQLAPTFLMYFILSEPFVRLMVDESMRVAMPKVNRDKLSACPVLLPPREEQESIVKHLKAETTKIDALSAKVREAIDRLKEYRTALISAAVTGKIDVRGEAA